MKIFWISKLVLFLPPLPPLCFQCRFPGLWGLVKERSNIIHIYVLMHETDTFTSLGHWELISCWLESSGKWKPPSNRSILVFLWICSWKWSQSGTVLWGMFVLLMVWAELGSRKCLHGCALYSLSDWICEIADLDCLDVNAFNEFSSCLEPLSVLQASPDELGDGVSSPW